MWSLICSSGVARDCNGMRSSPRYPLAALWSLLPRNSPPESIGMVAPPSPAIASPSFVSGADWYSFSGSARKSAPFMAASVPMLPTTFSTVALVNGWKAKFLAASPNIFPSTGILDKVFAPPIMPAFASLPNGFHPVSIASAASSRNGTVFGLFSSSGSPIIPSVLNGSSAEPTRYGTPCGSYLRSSRVGLPSGPYFPVSEYMPARSILSISSFSASDSTSGSVREACALAMRASISEPSSSFILP